MKKIFLILLLLFSINAFAGSSEVLKIEIFTIDDETSNGYLKTNNYFIDRNLNYEINLSFKGFIIETVHFTREKGKFTYSEKSVNYSLKPKINVNVAYDLHIYQAKI